MECAKGTRVTVGREPGLRASSEGITYLVRCDAHMNELPIPCGPWDIYYKDQQAWYNKCLAVGAIWWLFSLFMMIWSGSFYLNWGPPAQPGPPSDMVEECEDE
ncbi:uncharacterized protein LOC126369735 [Pectinophora gossypiella]|uniref:uncharacterized protein LOC126369735 n=1 Tax=Pectinophora gossypiella TaxID=13191 RepID=UPI00214E22F9|nr:uncharacterized protein LOC126369735 [Pectinophora gossypiella]